MAGAGKRPRAGARIAPPVQHARPASRPVPPPARATGRSWWRRVPPIVWLLAAALAAKLTVLAQLGGHPLLQQHGELDSTYYVELARRMAAGGPLAIREPFFVSPLYVYFLAVVFAITGGSLLAARLLQVLLGVAVVWLLFLTARWWFGLRAALVAAGLAVLTGLFTFYEILILQAALDPFLVALALFLTSRAQADERRWPLAAAGVAMAFLVLNRPNAMAWAVVAIALVAFASWMREPAGPTSARAWRALGRGSVVATALLLALALNALRNYAVAGEAVLVSSHGGLNFYIGNGPGAEGTYRLVEDITPSIAGQARDATRVAEAALGRPLSTAEVSRYFFGLARAWMIENPGAALRLFGRKLLYVLNRTDVPLNYSYAYYVRDEDSLLRALVVGPWLLVPLGILGLFLPSARSDRHGFWVWASFVPVYALSVAAFFVSSRYRMPLLVPLCATSAAVLVRAEACIRERRRDGLAAPAVALVLLATLTNWNLGLDDGRGGEQTRKAVWLIESGRYDEAAAYVDRIAPRHTHPGVLRFRVGQALVAAGETDDGIRRLREALEIDRGQAAIQLALGKALLTAGRPAEAVPQLKAALQAGFRPEEAGPALVRALMEAGQAEEARSLLAALPDSMAQPGTKAAFALGLAALELEATAVAERWLRIAVAQAPDHAEAQEKFGASLVLLNRAGEAVAPLEAACRLDPSSASARLNLAVAYAQLGRITEARTTAQEALRLDPREPRTTAFLAALPPGSETRPRQ